jgi:hypothetical protein
MISSKRIFTLAALTAVLGACAPPGSENVESVGQAIKNCPIGGCEPPLPPEEPEPPLPPEPLPRPILRAYVASSASTCPTRTVFFTVRNIGDAASVATVVTVTNNGVAPLEFAVPALDPGKSTPLYARTLDYSGSGTAFTYALRVGATTVSGSCP